MLGGCLLSGAKSDGKAHKRVGGWVLVTGASAGIGAELARAFATRRYDLVLAARNEAALEALGRELAVTCAINVKTAPVDLSEPGAPQALAQALAAAGVEVGVLVNNAGALCEGPFADGPIDSLVNLLQVNVVALTALTRLFLTPMVARGEGRILNVASIAAFMPVPDLAVYAASKAYVLSLTEALAVELDGTGVAATALCPGLTDTAMVRESKLGRAPAIMTMTAKAVAEAGCAACLSGEPILVPGLANRLVAGGAPLAPKALVRAIGGALRNGGYERLASVLQGLAPARGKGKG
jgi:short-subunit dehydrogenase